MGDKLSSAKKLMQKLSEMQSMLGSFVYGAEDSAEKRYPQTMVSSWKAAGFTLPANFRCKVESEAERCWTIRLRRAWFHSEPV